MNTKLAQKLADIANSGLPERDLILALEDEIAKIKPYKHESSSTMEACGFTQNIALSIQGEGTVSEIVEKIEKTMPKRELSFMVFKILTEQKESVEAQSKDIASDEDIDFDLDKFFDNLFK